jgi:hypothetical protein
VAAARRAAAAFLFFDCEILFDRKECIGVYSKRLRARKNWPSAWRREFKLVAPRRSRGDGALIQNKLIRWGNT